MPKTFALISTAKINKEEFIDLLHKTDMVISTDSIYDGRLSRGKQHVWVALDNRLLNDLEANDLELIAQKLTGIPQSSILLDVSRTPGSQTLAVDFACICAEKWPSVVYNLIDKAFSAQELFQLREAGKGFDE